MLALTLWGAMSSSPSRGTALAGAGVASSKVLAFRLSAPCRCLHFGRRTRYLILRMYILRFADSTQTPVDSGILFGRDKIGFEAAYLLPISVHSTNICWKFLI